MRQLRLAVQDGDLGRECRGLQDVLQLGGGSQVERELTGGYLIPPRISIHVRISILWLCTEQHGTGGTAGCERGGSG